MKSARRVGRGTRQVQRQYSAAVFMKEACVLPHTSHPPALACCSWAQLHFVPAVARTAIQALRLRYPRDAPSCLTHLCARRCKSSNTGTAAALSTGGSILLRGYAQHDALLEAELADASTTKAILWPGACGAEGVQIPCTWWCMGGSCSLAASPAPDPCGFCS